MSQWNLLCITSAICAFVLAAPCSSQVNLNSIEVDGVEDSYAPGEIIEFSVRNRSQFDERFSVSIEKLLTDRWQELDYSIFSKGKAVEFMQLPAHGSREITFGNNLTVPGEYRFRLEFSGMEVLVSRAFRIRP